jgi:hypothetical protein
MYARLSAKTLVLFTTMLIAGSVSNPVKGQTESRNLPAQNPQSLVGTWLVQTQITNCSGTNLESFSKMVSINAGGTAGEISNSLPPSQRTVAFGVWQHLDHNSFVYALRFFRFTPTGTFASIVEAKWSVSLDHSGDVYTGEGAIKVLSPTGVVIATLCGTETGTRMVIPE